MDSQTAYSKEFDERVRQYNKFLESLEHPKFQRQHSRSAFLKGIGSLFDFFGTYSINKTKYNQHLYSENVLAPRQKDAIALASDWQNAGQYYFKWFSKWWAFS